MGVEIAPTKDQFLALCLKILSREHKTHQRTAKLSYKCSVCSKAFSSYQALGGHKSSHRRPTTGLELIVRPVLSSSESSGSGGAHQCNVCYQSFATGQALGRHKRCHYWDHSLNSSRLSSNSGSVRDFDLNLPASGDEFGFVEDGEEVQSPHPTKKFCLH